MNKKKILKAIGIILLIIFVIFLVHTIRNYIIITNLQNKISKYYNSTNYHIKSTSISDEGTKVTMEYYKKDNKQVVFMERNLNGEIVKLSMYDNGERTDTFTESNDSKVVQLNTGEIMSINIYNFLENDNNWQTFLSSTIARVRTTEYNGKEWCHFIENCSVGEQNVVDCIKVSEYAYRACKSA